MPVKLTPIQKTAQEVLRTMMLDYFREIDPEKVVVDNGEERLDYPYFATYWTDEKRAPFFIQHDEDVVGFVLVNDWIIHHSFAANHSIAEFYIAPPFRRKGVGAAAAEVVFSSLPGKWEIRQSTTNLPAVAFWRRTIRDFTGGRYQEIKSVKEQENIQLFTS